MASGDRQNPDTVPDVGGQEITIVNENLEVSFNAANRSDLSVPPLTEDDRTLRNWALQILNRSDGTEIPAAGEDTGELKVSNYGKDASGNIDAIRTNANQELIIEIRDALLGRTGKLLGTSDPAATTNTNLYTVPASTTAQLTSLTACNRTASAVTIRIGIDEGGAGTNTPSADQWLYYDLSLAGNTTLLLDAAQGLWLATTDDLVVYASAQSIAFIATGVEYA